MDQLKQQAPHLIMALAVIGAVAALAGVHVITGGEALGIIAGAGGVSLGGAVGSLSNSGTATTPSVTVPLNVEATSSRSASSTAGTTSSPTGAVTLIQPASSAGDGSVLTPSVTS